MQRYVKNKVSLRADEYLYYVALKLCLLESYGDQVRVAIQ